MFIGIHFTENGDIIKACADDKFKTVRKRLLDNIRQFKLENNIPSFTQPEDIHLWKHPMNKLTMDDKECIKHYWTIKQI